MSHEGKVCFIGVVGSANNVSVVKLYPEYIAGFKRNSQDFED